MPAQDQPFPEAAQYWDLKTLYADLASAKGRHLTPTEKQHLRGLLSGHSPGEIAEKLHKNVNGVEVALCNTLYQYVKTLVGKGEDKLHNWRVTTLQRKISYYSHVTARSLSNNYQERYFAPILPRTSRHPDALSTNYHQRGHSPCLPTDGHGALYQVGGMGIASAKPAANHC